MANASVEGPASDATPDDGDWRNKALERSLQRARARAESRNERYIQTAMAILAETGRTDFTLQDLVERSKTSLRTFYLHFASKDELLLVLVQEVMDDSVAQWRKRTDTLDPLEGLRLVVDNVLGRTVNARFKSIARALSSFSIYLAEARPDDYGRVLIPLYDLLLELIERGVEAGQIRADIDPHELASVLTHTLIGAAQTNAFVPGRPEPSSHTFWEFLVGGVGLQPETAAQATPAPRKAAATRRKR